MSSRRTRGPPGVIRQRACRLTGGMGAQTPVTCKGPAVDYKRSLAAAAPVFKQARSSALPEECPATSRFTREGDAKVLSGDC